MIKMVFAIVFFLLLNNPAHAHGGRADSSGGHKCSQKSKDKGLCTGYHKHKKKPAYTNNEALQIHKSKVKLIASE